jgi:hypothetical protein
MVLAAFVGLSLVVTASVDARTVSPASLPNGALMSMPQKNAAMRPLVRSATDCIVRTVSTDARLQQSVQAGTVGELIVDSMASCLEPVGAMIDAYDRYFGDGSGEAFFMGPYLDVLPAAVARQVSGGIRE